MKVLTYKDKNIDKITPLYYLVDIPGYERLLDLKKDEKV